MASLSIPPMTVSFDDGTEIRVEPRPRDLVGAEATGHDFSGDYPIKGMYAVAFAALHRMARAGQLPEGVEPPASLQVLIDGADVEADEAEAAGKE